MYLFACFWRQWLLKILEVYKYIDKPFHISRILDKFLRTDKTCINICRVGGSCWNIFELVLRYKKNYVYLIWKKNVTDTFSLLEIEFYFFVKSCFNIMAVNIFIWVMCFLELVPIQFTNKPRWSFNPGEPFYVEKIVYMRLTPEAKKPLQTE